MPMDAISLPDVDDDNNDWNDDERENSVPIDSIRPTTPILNRTSIKSKTLRRRQTIGAVQGRQYRTPLRHIQAILWPTREIHTTSVNNHPSDEQEKLPMMVEKRSSTVHENNPTNINENPNERRKTQLIPQHSDTMVNI
ncbi:hypothetical protein I4U23_028749 [Adineta vaga]|nr:hypothetical protein I4U23_028749 [Adineta vaga]